MPLPVPMPLEHRQAFGSETRRRRRDRGLTQAQLAEAAGTSRSHIVQLEAAVQGPSRELAQRIASALGWPAEEALQTAGFALLPEGLPQESVRSIFAERLAEARANLGWQQSELGHVLGVTRSAVANWEAGRATPDCITLALLARALRVRTDWLLGRDNAPPASQLPSDLAALILARLDEMKAMLEELKQGEAGCKRPTK